MAPRQTFCCSPGTILLSADYAQMELRIVAYLAADKKLQAWLQESEFVHAYVPVVSCPVSAEDAEILLCTGSFSLSDAHCTAREDFFCRLGRLLFEIPSHKEVTPEFRTGAKQLVYSVLYGGWALGWGVVVCWMAQNGGSFFTLQTVTVFLICTQVKVPWD